MSTVRLLICATSSSASFTAPELTAATADWNATAAGSISRANESAARSITATVSSTLRSPTKEKGAMVGRLGSDTLTPMDDSREVKPPR